MKKSRILATLFTTIGVVGVAVTTATVLTSCSTSSDYNPDKSTKITYIVPDKKTYDKFNNHYKKVIEGFNKNNKPGWWTKGSFTVIGNKITITQIEKRGDDREPLNHIYEYTFDKTDYVHVKITHGSNVQEYNWTLERAKKDIYDELGLDEINKLL